MRATWLLALLLLFTGAPALAQDVRVPPGFVLQPLDPTDGQIARPRGWFYASQGTPSGWMWTLSREDTKQGPYLVGMRVQVLMGVEAGSGLTKPGFVQSFIDDKRKAGVRVVRDCPARVEGDFHRRCFEVIEALEFAGRHRDFHILYTLSWSRTMDMVALSIAGAPAEEWDAHRATFDAMSNIRLVSPGFGRGSADEAQRPSKPAATPFDTVYNHITPESESRGDDAKFKALYGDRFRFVDIASRPGFAGAKVTGGGLPRQAFAADGTQLTGNAVLAFIVSPDGRVVEPRLVSISDERLRDTVLAAVAAWRFAPATLDGKPVPTLAAQDFAFNDASGR